MTDFGRSFPAAIREKAAAYQQRHPGHIHYDLVNGKIKPLMKNRVSSLVAQQFLHHMFDANQPRADGEHNEPTEQENMGQACGAMPREAALQKHNLPEVAKGLKPTESFCIR